MVHIPRWQSILIVIICVLGALVMVPSFLSRATLETLPGWFPKRQVSLGLDLQGGSHLLLEVDTNAILDEDLNALVESARTGLRQAQVGYRNLGIRDKAVSVELTNPEDVERARKILTDLASGALVATDGAVLTIRPTEASILARQKSAVDQSIEIVRRRIDETGTREPIIQRQGRDRIVVQLPGVDDPERIKRLLGKTAKLTFHLLESTQPYAQPGMAPPPGTMILAGDKPDAAGQVTQYVVRRKVEVSGDRLIDAQPSFQNNEPVVSFRFDGAGAKKFGDATQQHTNEHLAIVLDGKVISAPVIREPILGGSGVISGSFTTQSAKDLALLLRAGALPAPLLVLEERTVGPSLGVDSIEAGELSGWIAFVAICAFMVASYGLMGVMADLALAINMVLIGAALALLQASLTLPGIAGIVLTIGMAVDANVLIFERIREEQRAGRTPVSAIDAGYRRAFGTIVDSNLTTLFPAMLMFGFGSGPIKGFAVTITIGIITSMFTSVMLTRLMVIVWLRRWRPKAIPI
ncbi:MAG: protein translocase subunit SecD [Alphaproteobacteria bacterium]|mgnify:CR=1 FL=1